MRRLVVTLVLGCLGAIGLWEASKAQGFQLFGETITRVTTDAPLVALTFDDGPSPRHTGAVLDILADRNVRGTFFLTGHEMAARPDQAALIVQGGHEIGNHSYSHDRLILKSPAVIQAEIDRTDALIRQAGWSGDIAFRPPYGQKLVVLPWVLSSADRPSVMWDVPEPEGAASPEDMAARIVAEAEPGSIILMHVMYDSRALARAALPLVIDGLRAKGLEPVSLAALIAAQVEG